MSKEERKRILFIHDGMDESATLIGTLKSRYDIITLEDSSVAISYLNNEKAYSAVILDFIIPDVSGINFMFNKTQIADIARIPVIVIADEKDVRTQIRAYNSGAVAVLTVPYNYDLALACVNRIVSEFDSVNVLADMQYDRITQVYTRDNFYKKVSERFTAESNQEFQMVTCDIERFKVLNEVLGAEKCDDLLAFIAQSLKDAFFHGDIIGRLVNDQFAIFGYRNDITTKQIISELCKKVADYNSRAKITIKFGIYTFNTDKHRNVSTICDRSLLALKEIKGKVDADYKYYDDSMRSRLILEQALINDMETALENGEFQVYIQPKYNIENGLIAGGEALARWMAPVRGMISPGQFIPLFEKNGFISKLDEYMWDKTAGIIRRMKDTTGKSVPVSVNISRIDIFHLDVPATLKEICQKHNILPEDLHLEITESAYMEEPEQLNQMVRALKRAGFSIEMDDFGSGYSSLSLLSDIPIDVMKLDMQLVKNLGDKNKDNMLSFIVAMAKWLGLMVVAEGVETKEQIEALKRMDCDYVQGFYYSKPVSHNEFIRMVGACDVAAMPSHRHESNKTVTDMDIPREYEGKIVLIVDDVKANRDVLRRLFDDCFLIIEAEDGRAAWELAKSYYSRIALIITNLIMPIMDGYKLLELLASDENTRNIPVVVASKMGENGEARCLKMGARDYVNKPFDNDTMRLRVKHILEAQLYNESRNTR